MKKLLMTSALVMLGTGAMAANYDTSDISGSSDTATATLEALYGDKSFMKVSDGSEITVAGKSGSDLEVIVAKVAASNESKDYGKHVLAFDKDQDTDKFQLTIVKETVEGADKTVTEITTGLTEVRTTVNTDFYGAASGIANIDISSENDGIIGVIVDELIAGVDVVNANAAAFSDQGEFVQSYWATFDSSATRLGALKDTLNGYVNDVEAALEELTPAS